MDAINCNLSDAFYNYFNHAHKSYIKNIPTASYLNEYIKNITLETGSAAGYIYSNPKAKRNPYDLRPS